MRFYITRTQLWRQLHVPYLMSKGAKFVGRLENITPSPSGFYIAGTVFKFPWGEPRRALNNTLQHMLVCACTHRCVCMYLRTHTFIEAKFTLNLAT